MVGGGENDMGAVANGGRCLKSILVSSLLDTCGTTCPLTVVPIIVIGTAWTALSSVCLEVVAGVRGVGGGAA